MSIKGDMRRWAFIALAIFVSWVLDQFGWLKPALWAVSWLVVALIGLASCVFLVNCVKRSLRPAEAPQRPGLLSIIGAGIRDAREEMARDTKQKTLTAAFSSAVQAAQSGQFGALETLASEGLGDAWFALANLLADTSSPKHDDVAATAGYWRAAQSTEWVNGSQAYAGSVWETRAFLGLGATPDYALLLSRWENGHFSGAGRELELAWLYANGCGVVRNAETAWYWLALRKARWGEREATLLPEGDVANLHAYLGKALTCEARERLNKKAADCAHAEFVASR
jgi:hypothetical protein